MSKINKLVAAHPIRKKPYNAIKFVRLDGQGTPLYRVGRSDREMGANEALKLAFETLGAHCFHCKKWISPQPLSQACTRDHLRPRKGGGSNYLHNLVFACPECNRAKGSRDIIDFSVEGGSEYLLALDAHIIRCLAAFER